MIEGLLLAAGSALLGGALALLARRRASLLELTRTFAFTAAAGVVSFHLLPEVLPALGPTALLWIAAGFVLPWLLEVGARVLGPDLLARRGIRGMRVAAEVGFAALLFHSLFEGLALLAALQGRASRTDLEIAIVAHHAPLTAAVALPFLDLLGVRATLIRVGLVALAGVLGVVFGNLVPGLASGADAAVLQRATAVVAGALLHVVADEIREQRFSSAGQRVLDLFAAAAGLSLAGLGAFLDVRTTGGILGFARTATALALGVAPALVTAQASPTGAAFLRVNFFHWLARMSFFRLESRFASMPLSPGRRSSPRFNRFLNRSSPGSIPKRVAAMSICDSPAKITWGAPMARKEPAEPEFV